MAQPRAQLVLVAGVRRNGMLVPSACEPAGPACWMLPAPTSLPSGPQAAGWAGVLSAAVSSSWWGRRVLLHGVPLPRFPPAPMGADEALVPAQG